MNGAHLRITLFCPSCRKSIDASLNMDLGVRDAGETPWKSIVCPECTYGFDCRFHFETRDPYVCPECNMTWESAETVDGERMLSCGEHKWPRDRLVDGRKSNRAGQRTPEE